MAEQIGPASWNLEDQTTAQKKTAEIVENFNKHNSDVLDPIMERLRFHAATKNFDHICLIGIARNRQRNSGVSCG